MEAAQWNNVQKKNALRVVWCCLAVRDRFHRGCGIQNGLFERTEAAYIVGHSRKLAGSGLSFPGLLLHWVGRNVQCVSEPDAFTVSSCHPVPVQGSQADRKWEAELELL